MRSALFVSERALSLQKGIIAGLRSSPFQVQDPPYKEKTPREWASSSLTSPLHQDTAPGNSSLLQHQGLISPFSVQTPLRKTSPNEPVA
eukprot:5992046-Amphidinium_carterae.1